ncbi:MAG: adenylate cyclase [Lachnospiraceae bacterium]|nr:adenylate cyclase [Lachnospiraceae bacterium]
MSNNLEIEKKYIVESLDKVMEYVDLDQCTKLFIEQGYLSNNPTIRVRKYNNDYCITYKSRIKNTSSKDVIVNREVELPLTEESYYHMIDKIDYNLIKKTRYKIELEQGLVAELDVFDGKLKGLIMVEVEFDNEKVADKFVEPKWFGKNVSADKKYKNLFLAQVESVDLL